MTEIPAQTAGCDSRVLNREPRAGSLRFVFTLRSAVLLAPLLAAGCASQADRAPQVVFEPKALTGSLRPAPTGKPRVNLLDVRSREDFETVHVKGAVWVDLVEWTAASRSKDQDLTHAQIWQVRIDALGIDPNRPVVVCDGGKMTDAARVWFILQRCGVMQACVLNGGFPALQPLLPADCTGSGPPQPPAGAKQKMPWTDFRPVVALVDKSTVRSALISHDAMILDARTQAEYTGRDPRKNPRAGHLPGAVNLPHERLLDEQGRLRSAEELRDIFAACGFKAGQKIIAHCESGGRASLAALAAVQAGYGPVGNYYMSFSEWAADESCAIEAPTTQPAK